MSGQPKKNKKIKIKLNFKIILKMTDKNLEPIDVIIKSGKYTSRSPNTRGQHRVLFKPSWVVKKGTAKAKGAPTRRIPSYTMILKNK